MEWVPGPCCALELPRAWLPLLFLRPPGFVLLRHHSRCSPGAHRSQKAARSWQGSGRGPDWHWSRNAADWSWHNPVAVCTCRHRGVRSKVRATAPALPDLSALHQGWGVGTLTASPECTSHSRRQLHPHSPRRWNAPHMLQPSHGPSAGRRGPVEQGSHPCLVRVGAAKVEGVS